MTSARSVQRIAIINRGEAASRGLRAVKELRLEEGSRLVAIALYTEPDRSSPFVRQADVAISLGPALRGARGTPPRPAYLDRPRVLAALRATRADSVWPGWGFLAEDPQFVEQLEHRGITFIGPSSAAMRAVGDKIVAKRLAESAGVPVAPWSAGPVSRVDLVEAAERVGYPLMIKAAAGGGGRGIRVVRNRDDLGNAFERAVAEATHAFGDGNVFLEALVPRPRHVEVQIAADHFGQCLALGLRDCSVQRRHQKVIEESPPPHLSAAIATALREAAVRLSRAAGYVGIGTVEFLLDADGRSFYFLEVNSRLQVEHGLTEALTGLDLVKLQIRLARGEALPAVPPAESGHAIEARVCAEDPSADFVPAPGTVALLDLPSGTGVRTDCGVALGAAIPAEFDQLIAKVIAHGPSRDAALARLFCALADFRLVLTGGATNKGFLLDLLAHEEVQRGGVDVQWLDRMVPELPAPPNPAEALIVTAILTYLRERATARLNFFAEAVNALPRSIPPSMGQTIDLTYRGQAYRLHVLAIGDWAYQVRLDGRECVATLLEQEANACQLVIGDERFAITYAPNDGGLRVEVNGQPHVVGRDTGGQVRATTPAVVIAIDVDVGERVEAGQRLGLLEAMKVEIAFTAPTSGTVKAIHVRQSERVAAGAVLMIVQPEVPFEVLAPSRERVVLPECNDPLRMLFGPSGEPDWHGHSLREVPDRERALQALTANVRRVLLGYDVAADHDAQLLPLLHDALPQPLTREFLAELAELRQTLTVFADTEVLFWREPESEAGGTLGPSNDAWLRLYLRRITARGAGVADHFLGRLRRALAHYGLDDLTPGEALERALLRLYAAQTASAMRYRLATAVLRFLTRIANAGVDLAGDQDLARALSTCMVLRGQVPEALADAAAEARYTIFELPHIRRQAAAAATAVEESLRRLEARGAAAFDLETLIQIADSPPQIFAHIGAWMTDTSRARRDLALQALVLRQYAPLVPSSCVPLPAGHMNLARVEFAERGVLLAALSEPERLALAWDALGNAAAGEATAPALEILLPLSDQLALQKLREDVLALMETKNIEARRLCCTGLLPDGTRAHVVYERAGDRHTGLTERTDLMGLHPETARRIDLGRLADFSLEHLPSPEGVYAFHGRSRRIPSDERFFVLAEVRAAVPGTFSTLHESEFVHTYFESVRALRNLRAARDQRRRLHWNRITIFLRPALTLPPSTVDRLVRELMPAARHLGLEKIVVRLALRTAGAGSPAKPAEIVVDPSATGQIEVGWREPHLDALRPASEYERRIAQARRRGLTYPYEAIRLFVSQSGEEGESRGQGSFEEFDLDPNARYPTAVSVHHRPPGGNGCGVIFGIITTITAKHPEGMTRILVLSDPTRDMGALAKPECDRLVAALDLAAARQIPLEWVAVSAGARIAMDSGTENLDATATVVRRIVRFTQTGGEINVIVAGVNVGAQSYFNALATMLMHTRGILVMLPGTSMVLTGRVALEASGGVSAEDEVGIGGFERIMGPNGQAQYYARDLTEAYGVLLQHYRYTYVASAESGPRRLATSDAADRPMTASSYPSELGEGFATIGDIFEDATNPGRKRPFAMRSVVRALIDRDGGWLERWTYLAGGETSIVGDAHLGGHPICLIAIESRALPRLGYRPNDGPDQWSGGTLFPLSSKKISRALVSASGSRPAVILANLTGFDGSPESMRKLQLEYGAEIARAVVNFVGPILFVVMARYHGGAYVVFSRALNRQIQAFALRGSYASVIGGAPAATVVFAREVEGRTDADPRIAALRERLQHSPEPGAAADLRAQLERLIAEVTLEKQGEIAREFDAIHTVERACAVGSLDTIVSADQLRALLIAQLDTALQRSGN